MGQTLQLNSALDNRAVFVFSSLPELDYVNQNSSSKVVHKNLQLYMKNFVLPGISVGDLPINYQNVIYHETQTVIEYPALSITYDLDDNWTNYLVLRQWVNDASNAPDGVLRESNELKVPASLIIYNNHLEKVAEFTFTDVQAISISDIEIAYDKNNEEPINNTVVFNYNYFVPTSQYTLAFDKRG